MKSFSVQNIRRPHPTKLLEKACLELDRELKSKPTETCPRQKDVARGNTDMLDFARILNIAIHDFLRTCIAVQLDLRGDTVAGSPGNNDLARFMII